MARLDTALGLNIGNKADNLPQCVNCPFGKQACTPFQKSDSNPENVGDIIVSNICGPFENSIGGYKYLITWLEYKTRFANIDFLKNKECSTISESFD